MDNTVLRFIDDGGRDAVFNMAADMYLLKKSADDTRVCLRFYEWTPPAISTGYMQDAGSVINLGECLARGVSWIRRPTGGRAVLHWGDLTYSCAFSRRIKSMGASVSQTYSLISDCLIEGFCSAGIECAAHDTAFDTQGARREKKLPCFLAPNRREIMFNGKKLAGSAQKRSSQAVLQHGSIPFTPDFRCLPDFENADEKEREAHREMLVRNCTCVSEIRPGCSLDNLKQSLAEAFADVLGITMMKEGWSGKELSDIESFSGSDEFRRQCLEQVNNE